MIRQDQNPTGRSNSGRVPAQRNYNRSASFLGLGDLFGGGGQSTQTTTQQNLPDWAIPDAMSTLAMGNYYTQNPDYRASTLDRDYSGIRGYNQMGQPNSQAGQFGLNPTGYTRPLLADPPLNDINLQRSVSDNLILQSPMNLGRGRGRSAAFWGSDDSSDSDNSSDDSGWSWEAPQIDLPDWNFDSLVEGTWLDNRPQSDPGELAYPTSLPETPTQSPQGDIRPDGSNSEGSGYPTGNDPPAAQTQPTSSGVQGSNTNTTNTTTTEPTIDPRDIFNPDDLTPFQAYDRQRFAAPGVNTLLGEGILAGRYNQRFGPGGTDPFADAKTAADKAANYQSQYTPAELKLQGPTANTYNNVLSGFGNVNEGMRSETYGNANEGLLGQQDYTTGRSFQDRVQDFMNPYTDQVVNRSLQDINRARQMADLSTMGGAAKSGAFGGSREALMRAENTRNALDQAARTSGELRSAGFNTAANLAQQEELQRLGLTASDRQNLRGYQSAGNLQGQSLTAADLQNVRGYQSAGGLAAQGYQAEGALNAQNLGAQSDRDAMSFQQQLQQQGNQIAADQARLAEQFRQGAGALNLQGAGALGDLAQAGTADERQRIADLLASGQAGDARNQQDLDFIYGEFNRELAYPGQQIDLRNAAISPATGSIVTTTQPRYEQNPLLAGIGAGIGTYGMTQNPYLALLAGGASLLSS